MILRPRGWTAAWVDTLPIADDHRRRKHDLVAGVAGDDASVSAYLTLDVASIIASPWLSLRMEPANSSVIRASASERFLDPERRDMLARTVVG
jgi:hypothetical protein